MTDGGEEMLKLLANDLFDMETTYEPVDEQYEQENSENVPARPNETGQGRFRDVSVEDAIQFVKDHENKNTSTKTKSDIKIFNDWKAEPEVSETRAIKDIPVQELDNLLARFYLAIRKKDGSEYEPNSVTSIQYSIERYLKENNAGFSKIKDPTFAHSNAVLLSKRKNLKAQGKGNLKSKAEPLTKQEIQSLRDKGLLGTEDPGRLLNSVWLNNGVYFAMRGRQDHTNLLWGDVELKTTSDHREYLEFTERSTKTRNGASRNCARRLTPKTFSKPEYGDLCPINIYKAYRDHRPSDMCQDESRFYLTTVKKP